MSASAGSFASKEMATELLRLSDIGGAIGVLGKVAEVVQIYDHDYENATDLLDQLNNGYVTGGINTAMAELGGKVADLAERLADLVRDGEGLQ